MNRAIKSHPEPERLLRYADGDLEQTASEEIAKHLVECSDCQTWLNQLETGVADYSREWMPIFREEAAAPPAPWIDLRDRMAAFDRQPAVASRAPSRRLRPQWGAIAAAVLIALVTGYWFSEQPVSAAQLLRKAADREAAADHPRPAIRMSSRSGSITRPAVWRPSAKPSAADAARVRSLQVLFETADYNWEDPLSARSFSTWRESLADGQDQVVNRRGADGINSYEISTRSASGALAEARLVLRVSDFHAVNVTLRFRGDELVEITEIAGGSPDLPAPPPLVAGSPSTPARSANEAEEAITSGDELRVWAALRRIDADLGEPIDVERDPSANAIVVTALGLSPDRRRTLENALSPLPRIQLRFRDPQPTREPSRSLPSDPGIQAPLQPKLESQFGSRSLAEEFTNRILEASESALLRAHAIRQLAQHFPPETRLSPEDRALLNSLLVEHFAALDAAARRVLTEARQIVAIETPAPALPEQSWQVHARNLVAAMERTDQLLTRLLATGGSAGGQTAFMPELERALSRVGLEIAAAEPVFREAR